MLLIQRVRNQKNFHTQTHKNSEFNPKSSDSQIKVLKDPQKKKNN